MATTLTEVTMPGCVDCARFKKAWNEKLSDEFPNVEFEEVSAESDHGQELVGKHGIMASPGIVINGELFSVGPVNIQKLRDKLNSLES